MFSLGVCSEIDHFCPKVVTIRGERQQAAQSGDKLLMDEFKSRTEWRDQALSCLSKFLYVTVELFKRAIDVLVRFVKSMFNVMDVDEAGVDQQCIDHLGKTDKDRQALANMMINHICSTNNESQILKYEK